MSLVAGVAIVSSCQWTMTPETPSSSSVKIMPLGDSITDGYFVPGGYRIDLWQHLTERGYAIDFVGSLRNGSESLPDTDHEGHSGWRIEQIHHRIRGWLNRSQPDIILLLIGTNDMAQGYDVEKAPDRLGVLIEDIFQQLPEVKLFVASIPPIGEPFLNDRVINYNREIAELVQQKQTEEKALHFVDLYYILSLDDLPDGVHPNREGFRKIAKVWDEAMEGAIAPRSDRVQ
ncbi:MAG: SGNH/GDSL hydrolase family protein [Geitlerinemataceae cyanobacterium]